MKKATQNIKVLKVRLCWNKAFKGASSPAVFSFNTNKVWLLACMLGSILFTIFATCSVLPFWVKNISDSGKNFHNKGNTNKGTPAM